MPALLATITIHLAASHSPQPPCPRCSPQDWKGVLGWGLLVQEHANIPSFNAIKQDLTGVGDSCSEDEVGDTAQARLNCCY